MGMSRLSALVQLLPFAALVPALAICLGAKPLGRALSVVDLPDGERKHHSGATPLVGGIAVIISLALWCAASYLTGGPYDWPLLQAILLCGTGVALVGFADDQSTTLPLARASSLVIFLLIAFAIDRNLIAPHLLWGSFAPTLLPSWAMGLLFCVAMVGFVNAVNMADGQNGIVASMYVAWSLCLIVVSNGSQFDPTISGVSQLLLAASVLVLAFNLADRLFLGDCGTYGISFVFGLLAIAAHAKGLVSVETIIVWFFVPVVDCLRLVITRPMRGLSPLQAGRDHFQHRLQDKLGESVGLFSYLGIVLVPSLIAALEPHFALVCIAALCAIYFSFAFLTDTSVAAEDPVVDAPQLGSNVVSLVDGELSRKAR
jgi:UDP-GlcNAc:undecaprenyl-phosphate GlcNAc-1-phosphate transferase